MAEASKLLSGGASHRPGKAQNFAPGEGLHQRVGNLKRLAGSPALALQRRGTQAASQILAGPLGAGVGEWWRRASLQLFCPPRRQ